MNKLIVVLFSVLVVSTMVAQVSDKEENKTDFNSTALTKMSLEYNGFFKKYNYKELNIATIIHQINIPLIEFIHTVDSNQQNIFWLVIKWEDNSTQFYRLNFKKDDKGFFRGNEQFVLFTDSYDEYGLEFIVDLTQQQLHYKWIGSEKSTSMKGGLPIAKPTLIKVGKPMPEISVNSLLHKTQKVNKIEDHVVVINWWSRSCPPCKEEIPNLNKLVEKYSNKKVEFIAIGWNSEPEIQEFLNEIRFDYSHFVYNDSAGSILGNRYPRNIVVDRNGLVIYDCIGYDNSSSHNLDVAIGKALNER